MRLFRPTYKGKDGKSKKVSKWWIELPDPRYHRTVRRFAGFTDKGQTELLGRQIARLINYKFAGEQPDAKMSRWLESIPLKLRNQLVGIGLLDASRAAAGKPLREHIQDFLQSVESRGAVKRHLKQIKSRLTTVFTACRFMVWSDIQASKIEFCLAELRAKRGIGAATSNYYLQDVKQFARWMVEDGRASKSPVGHLKKLNVKVDIRRKRRALDVDELRRLLETTQQAPVRYGMTGPERALLYRVAVETGLRKSELRSLTVSSFDFKNRTITIEAAYSKNRNKSIQNLKQETALLLQEHLRAKLPSAKIFSRMTVRTADMLKYDLAAARIPYADKAGQVFDFHALRGQCASLLAASGVHPKVAQQIMRHSDINLTMSKYTHTLTGQESTAIENLPDLGQPSKQQQAKATGTDDLAAGLADFPQAQQSPTRPNEVKNIKTPDNGAGNGTSGPPNQFGILNTKERKPLTNKALTKSTDPDLSLHLADCPDLKQFLETWDTLSPDAKKAAQAIIAAREQG